MIELDGHVIFISINLNAITIKLTKRLSSLMLYTYIALF